MSDEISALIRHVMTAAGGALVAGGYMTSDQWATVVGAISILAGVAWSIISKRMAKSPTPTPPS
jgi:hypothetical protein